MWVRVFEIWESVRVLTAGAAERTPGTWLSRDPDLREITRVIPTLAEQWGKIPLACEMWKIKKSYEKKWQRCDSKAKLLVARCILSVIGVIGTSSCLHKIELLSGDDKEIINKQDVTLWDTPHMNITFSPPATRLFWAQFGGIIFNVADSSRPKLTIFQWEPSSWNNLKSLDPGDWFTSSQVSPDPADW